MKKWYLKFHRWIALTFSLPLLVVLVTGLILSVEPWLIDRAVKPGTLTADRIEALLAQHDPQGKARMLGYRSYDHALMIGVDRRNSTTVDVETGAALPGQSGLTAFLITCRRLHETLMLEARWLVIASTAAMLVLSVIGILMGLPRINNTLGGWHKAMAWFLLPLILLSPATALLMAMGVGTGGGFGGPPGAGSRGAAPMPLMEAVRVLGDKYDLAGLLFLRQAGDRYIVRLDDGGEFRAMSVSRTGVTMLPRNWPRLWHEGNFAGLWSSLMNLVISVAMVGLLVTGVWIWLRRQIRRRARRAASRPARA
ncbi:MAG: PepSY domain-containing protein [Proteobacteria bacterium]|nr:PepSY domain-containing protein [Pseudomonadota bacterium]